MKLIDEKGRLFGKINLIDFLVISFLLCFLPASYFAYKILIKGPRAIQGEFIEIERDCQFIKVRPEVLPLISVGDQELGGNWKVIGEIVSLGTSEPYKYEFDIGGGEKIVKESADLRQQVVKLKLKVVPHRNGLYYKNKLIKIGSPLEFKTDEYTLHTIVNKERKEGEKETIAVETDCRFIKVRPEVLPLISVGDKELGGNWEVIGEIVSLGTSEPYKYEFDIGGGEKVVKQSHDLKQQAVKLKLKAVVQKGGLYYKNRLIKIGSPLEFQTDEYHLIAVPSKEEKRAKEEKREKLVFLRVKFNNLMPELAEVIKKADKQIEIAEDSTKKVVANINKIIDDQPAEYISWAAEEKTWTFGGHPKNRDLILEIETLCILRPDGGLYLKNKPVKIGDHFQFSTNLYSLTGIIIGMELK
ncbi:DUF4330 domain-containing protein [Candidatus Omnitrophota bacterium]